MWEFFRKKKVRRKNVFTVGEQKDGMNYIQYRVSYFILSTGKEEVDFGVWLLRMSLLSYTSSHSLSRIPCLGSWKESTGCVATELAWPSASSSRSPCRDIRSGCIAIQVAWPWFALSFVSPCRGNSSRMGVSSTSRASVSSSSFPSFGNPGERLEGEDEVYGKRDIRQPNPETHFLLAPCSIRLRVYFPTFDNYFSKTFG